MVPKLSRALDLSVVNLLVDLTPAAVRKLRLDNVNYSSVAVRHDLGIKLNGDGFDCLSLP
jgi:hypothetical protein